MSKSSCATPSKPAAPLGLVDPILALAINALKAPKHIRAGVEPGVYGVQATLTIDAAVTVGEDYEAEQVNKVDPWFLLSLALDKLGPQALESLVQEAEGILARKDQAEDLDEEEGSALEELKERTAIAIARIKGSTKVMKKGAVKVLATLREQGSVKVQKTVTVTKKIAV